ncbi:MAG: isoaspartyl peptidase/L-asparaginase [Gemmatimonadota bacterium]|nr:isoaspartyl peptidase/L-asparaginase [Gemmatimonadota bacterium]
MPTPDLHRRSSSLACGLAIAALLLLAAPGARAQTLVIHGGAGTLTPENVTPERAEAYRTELEEALRTGWTVLEGGGPALDAVEATIRVMEDSPLFNAGKGAVFTHEGRNELDASIMDGSARDAGAVAGVAHVKNPISLARLVMEESKHVMLAREGAEEFALERGVELVPSSYFFTERRWRSLQRARERDRETSRAPEAGSPLGTVGAVALDADGDLAAGTSTGGMTDKRWGRIGDSPVIAAGTWADEGCAVSATGHGEFFIRNAVAHDICARVRYTGATVREAAETVILEDLVEIGASGGVIVLDDEGAFATPFNTAGMLRGWIGPDGIAETRLFAEGEEDR